MVNIANTVRAFSTDHDLTLPTMTPAELVDSLQTLRDFAKRAVTFTLSAECVNAIGNNVLNNATVYYLTPSGYNKTAVLKDIIGTPLTVKANSIIACDWPVFGYGIFERGHGIIICDSAIVIPNNDILVPGDNTPQ